MLELEVETRSAAEKTHCAATLQQRRTRARVWISTYLCCIGVLFVGVTQTTDTPTTDSTSQDAFDGALQHKQSLIKGLDFMHIPKNAGTSIEDYGEGTLGVEWGRFRYRNDTGEVRGTCGIAPWHDPALIDRTKKCFCVVRDPTERWVSAKTAWH
jgi:hypothetical protein